MTTNGPEEAKIIVHAKISTTLTLREEVRVNACCVLIGR